MVLSAVRDRTVTQSRNLGWGVRQTKTPPFQQTTINREKIAFSEENMGTPSVLPMGFPR